MRPAKRRIRWEDMDHDHELLYEEEVRRASTVWHGPIAEFLDKKQAEQERKTYLGYRAELLRFCTFLGEDATVGDVNDPAGHRYLAHLKTQQLSANSIATAF